MIPYKLLLLSVIYIALASATNNDDIRSSLESPRKKAQLSTSGLEKHITSSIFNLPQDVQQKTLLMAARIHDPVTLANIMATRSDIAFLILKSNDSAIYEKMPKAIEHLMHNDDHIKTVTIIFQYPRLVDWISPSNSTSQHIVNVMSTKNFESFCDSLYDRVGYSYNTLQI
jgi:hypothetical protein